MEQNLNILGAKMWQWEDCEVYKEAAGFKEDVRILVNFRIAHLIKYQKLLVKYENKIVSNPLGISNVLKRKWCLMIMRVF